ncbi:MAG: TIGR02281 family clan AA aspartic protease [Methylobacterium sp.]|nr:TIGR02281 family clan AA aspartic protease [Methylobacterium sp.]
MSFRMILMVAGLAIGGANLAHTIAKRQSEPAAPEPVKVASANMATPAARVVALQADRRGHFAADLWVNNQFVKTLVDTGASVVAFSHEDAQKAGIHPKPGDYVIPVQTANGVVRAAKARIPELRLQGIVVRDVEATVMPPGALNITLLGMSFLKRLKSFEMNGNTLILKQ